MVVSRTTALERMFNKKVCLKGNSGRATVVIRILVFVSEEGKTTVFRGESPVTDRKIDNPLIRGDQWRLVMSSLAQRIISFGLILLMMLWTQALSVSCGYIAINDDGPVFLTAKHDEKGAISGKIVLGKYSSGGRLCESGVDAGHSQTDRESFCHDGNGDHFPLIDQLELLALHSSLAAPPAVLYFVSDFFDGLNDVLFLKNGVVGATPHAKFVQSMSTALLATESVVFRV